MEQILRLIEINQYRLPELLFMVGIVLVVTWLAVSVWVLRDITTRSRNFLVIIGSFFLVLITNVAGLLIYVLIRPARTLEDAQTHQLFYAGVVDEHTNSCPGCSCLIRNDYSNCPNCGVSAKVTCPGCEERVNPVWHNCAYCGEQLVPDPVLKRFYGWLLDKLNVFGKRIRGIRLPKFPKLRLPSIKLPKPSLPKVNLNVPRVLPASLGGKPKKRGRGRPKGSKNKPKVGGKVAKKSSKKS